MKEISNKNEIVKNSNELLHPKSRKCIALKKKLKKKTKKIKAKQESRFKQTLIADKLLWIQNNMDADICPYTTELTALLIEKYIARNDTELEQIQIKRSIGSKRYKQHASREDAIRITKEQEKADYENCGIEIPNILNPVQCNMLKQWNGDLKFLPNFKFCYFSKKCLDKKFNLKDKIQKERQNNSENKSKLNILDNLKEITNKSDDLKSNNQKTSSIEENQDKMDVM